MKKFVFVVSMLFFAGCEELFTDAIDVSRQTSGSLKKFSADGMTFYMTHVDGGLSYKAGVTENLGSVTVANSYWIAVSEVTYELFDKVQKWSEDPLNLPTAYTIYSPGTGSGSYTNVPVTQVSWRSAMVWCNALTEWYNAMNGTNLTYAYCTTDAYDVPVRAVDNAAISATTLTAGNEDNPYVNANATGFRLLSTAEWELAARYQGKDSRNGAYRYPDNSDGYFWTPGNYASGGSVNIDDTGLTADEILASLSLVAWYSGNTSGKRPVKSLSPNILGLYDMSGNAAEWAFDWYTADTTRVYRGGAYSAADTFLRIGYDNAGSPVGSADVGFRIGMSAQ